MRKAVVLGAFLLAYMMLVIGINVAHFRFIPVNVVLYATLADAVVAAAIIAAVIAVVGRSSKSVWFIGDTIRPVEFAEPDRLVWTAVSNAERYHVYRDLVQNIGYAHVGTCVDILDPNPLDTEFEDQDVPLAGAAWGYVITAESASGREGTMGDATCTERSNFAPCP